MNAKKSLAASLIGTVVALAVCFSPLLVLVLGALGLSSWFGWIDSTFHLVLVMSVALGIYSLIRYIRRKDTPAPVETSGGL